MRADYPLLRLSGAIKRLRAAPLMSFNPPRRRLKTAQNVKTTSSRCKTMLWRKSAHPLSYNHRLNSSKHVSKLHSSPAPSGKRTTAIRRRGNNLFFDWSRDNGAFRWRGTNSAQIHTRQTSADNAGIVRHEGNAQSAWIEKVLSVGSQNIWIVLPYFWTL